MLYVRRPCLWTEEGFILSLSQQIIPESSTSHRRWIQLPQNVVFGFDTWMPTSFRSTTFVPSSVTETAFTQIVCDSVIRRKIHVLPGNEHLYGLLHDRDSRRHLTAEVRVRSESFQVVFVVEIWHGGRILYHYFAFPSVGIISPILQTHLTPTLCFCINWQRR